MTGGAVDSNHRCVNQEYHVNLVPADCHYDVYPYPCPCCGQIRNIVVGFRLRGRARMLFRG